MTDATSHIIGVLLPLPFNEPFDYKTDEPLVPGAIVRVPWGKEQQIGVVWKIGASSKLPEHKIKPVIEVFNFPPLSSRLISFIKFVADYNMAFLGMVLRMVISVRGVFDDSRTTILYQLSGKTLAEAKLKNSDARWQVMDLLRHAPYSKNEICRGAALLSQSQRNKKNATVKVTFFLVGSGCTDWLRRFRLCPHESEDKTSSRTGSLWPPLFSASRNATKKTPP